MNCLGCDINDINNIKTHFKHPSADYNVVVFLDACHMVKLMRNIFESKKIIHAVNGKIIMWQFLIDLCNLQEEHGLHLANKLTQRHINFKNQIMNIKFQLEDITNAVLFSSQNILHPAILSPKQLYQEIVDSFRHLPVNRKLPINLELSQIHILLNTRM